MKALTETELRRILMDRTVPAWTVPAGVVPTPAALDFLKERNIKVVWEEPGVGARDGMFKPLPPGTFMGPGGEVLDHKPEGLTHLNGRRLVPKNHPVIIWRGRLDSLCAKIISAQHLGVEAGREDFTTELEEILNFVRALLPAELRGEKVPEFKLAGLDAQAVRERSHNPVKYFGHRHLKASWRMGRLSTALNELRSEVRQVELAAAAAFQDEFGRSDRDDVIMALNRLSSLFYVLMFKYLPPGFTPEHSGI
ncbi:MAG: cobalamin adenosyltransferase [Deltaproteobacteria bacterium]|jgi:ethanolamine utilization cobalamin adenosyltransferase|nr:cobalamin adenosyltransferase [Deltaproteobacteria bacterium]